MSQPPSPEDATPTPASQDGQRVNPSGHASVNAAQSADDRTRAPEPPSSLIQWWLRVASRAKHSKWLIGATILLFVVIGAFALFPDAYKARILDTVLNVFASTSHFDNYSNDAFEILDRTTTVNLSAWQRVPPQIQTRGKYSPVLYRNTLRITKERTTAAWFLKEHWTSGLPIDFASTTHEWDSRTAEGIYRPGEIRYDKYEVALNVAALTVDTPFILDYQAVYWNAFQGNEEEDTGVAIVHPTRKLTLKVIMPFRPRASQLRFQQHNRENNNDFTKMPSTSCEIADYTVTCTVDNPPINRSYYLHWTWPAPYRRILE